MDNDENAVCGDGVITMKIRLPIYTCMHFLVDLTCIYRLYAWVMPQSGTMENWILLVVLYNFLAFALPGVVGVLADMKDSSDGMAAVGCVLAALPLLLPAAYRWSVLATVILQGIGNGFFHVGAGRRVLLDSCGKYAPAGIFISSGAMGVFLGTVWKHKYRAGLLMGLALSLLVCAVILCIFAGMNKQEGKEDPVRKYKEETGHLVKVSVLMLLLVVILRSFYGTAVSYEWKNGLLISFLFSCCIVAGKATGGIVADRIGVRKAALLSVGGAAVTVLFSANSPLLGCISILLFNMTMPLTLSLLADYWKEYPGFAFGMLMLCLFIGTVPDLVGRGLHLTMWELCTVSLISLAGLLVGIGREDKEIVP